MVKLLNKLLLLALPLIVLGFLVFYIDPFNYFNCFEYVPNSLKYSQVHSINPVLWDTINYVHDPSSNIIIGDSRAEGISIDYLKRKTGKIFKHLTATAGKINEIEDYFWFATSYKKLENVYIVLNFNMYNHYAFANRIVGAEAVLKNPLLYIYNTNVLEASYLILKSSVWKDNIKTNSRRMSKDEFWQWTLNNYAYQQYGKWKYPAREYNRLEEISNFCKNNNINLIFIITPHHKDFQQKVAYYNLEKEQMQFKKDLSNLAPTYDFDYKNDINDNKDNFRDPQHVKGNIEDLIVDEVVSGNLKYGRLLKTLDN